MARFRPFRGVRFSPDAIGTFDGVVAPPYDVISAEARDELYEASPYNVTRLILNVEGHAAAGRTYREWRRRGVLVREESPAFYLYRQDFDREGQKSRVGVVGAMYLEPFSTGVVRPHEQTFAHHKKDRLELTAQVEANLSPIFGLYSNPEFDPRPDSGWEEAPAIDVLHDGIRNRMWPVRKRERIEEITEAVAGRTVFIADGHHRYETALNYYAERNPSLPLAAEGGPTDDEAPTAHVMAFLARFEDPGMLILPTHRELISSHGAIHDQLVEALSREFDVQPIERSAAGRQRLLALLAESNGSVNAFGVALRDASSYLFLSKKVADGKESSLVAKVDVAVLHTAILQRLVPSAGGRDVKLEYSSSASTVLDRVDHGMIEGAFLLRPMRAEQMAEVCMAGELLPHKTTYFYPKLLTGLVFHSLAD